MAEKDFYAAIDLGTTNSVIAYANVQGNRIRPLIMDLDRKNETGSRSRRQLLPSVVHYYKKPDGTMAVEVGDYAKSRIGISVGHVCRSVKSLMGVSQQVNLAEDVPDSTPAEVSGRILSYLVNGTAKRLFQNELRDVVITVPASFDSDQCQATMEAARIAGINVDNKHDILLYEPKAVIYDFMRMQEEGEIISDLLCLDEPKNVMVFDLGGGTLDVTLHKVSYSSQGILNIRDLAISRYTKLGGDNFDDLLARDMLRRFEEMYDIKVRPNKREEVMGKLLIQAEHLKTALSVEYENAAMNDVTLPEDYEFNVMIIDLYDSYSYEDYYTRSDIEEIVAPLMGYSYKASDVSRIQNMGEKDVDNLIYPILDVMDKAGKDVKIDAVILNGGMTKFYLIRHRLRDFFGFEPLCTSDPDLAVARGAVYYHYCLHKYNVKRQDYAMLASEESRQEPAAEVEPVRSVFTAGTILNDSINLGLRGEYVSMLLPAGTELPYRSEEIRDIYKLDHETDMMGIEMFLGRGKTKNLPNRRIATRTVKFERSYPAGTPISFRIYIDSMRMMTMEAWITDRPLTRTIMEMDMTSGKEAAKAVKGLATTQKLRLNAKSEINELKALAARNKNRPGHDLNEAIKRNLDSIAMASNPEDFFEPCMDVINSCQMSDPLLGSMYVMAERFADSWTEDQMRRVLRAARRHFDDYALGLKQSIYVKQNAILLITTADPDFLTFFEEYLTRYPAEKVELKQVILLNAITKSRGDLELIRFLDQFLQIPEMNKWMAHKLVLRFGRGTGRCEQKKLSKLVKKLAQALSQKDRESIPMYLPVLIAELCGGDGDNPLQNDSYTMKPAWKAVKGFLDDEGNEMLTQALTNMWNGLVLSEGENRMASEYMQEIAVRNPYELYETDSDSYEE